MGYVTPEQIAQAKEWDLLTYLQRYDPHQLVHVGGSTYCTREHDSLKISNGKWNWFSRKIGGKTALDYLIKVQGFSFTQAVEALAGPNLSHPPPAVQAGLKEQGPRKLVLPQASRCATHIVSYLHGRGIDYDVIDYCIQTGRLYESLPYHNAVFVGRDENGTAKHAHMRSTNSWGDPFRLNVEGCDPRYSFHYDGKDGRLYVFEAPIDLLSYISLHPDRWQDHSYVACCGTSAIPVITCLDRMARPEEVVLCLDNDGPGRTASAAIQKKLSEYEVIDNPPHRGKDYNDQLQLVKGISGRVKTRGGEAR